MPEPLFMSVQQGNLRLLMQLISKDPNGINTCDESGQTILHSACSRGEVDIVLYLLQKRECNLQAQEQVYMHTPLHIACLFDQQRIVQELLRTMSPDLINKEDKYGWSALHHAARNGNLEVCRMLITSGATPALKNLVGKTALHYAAEHGHLHILTYLYDYVVTEVTPPILSDSVLDCPTLLHCAASNAHSSVSQWLQGRSYPPASKCKRILDYHENRSCEQYPDEIADARGHSGMRSLLQGYRQKYQEWISDITQDRVALDRIKLCICGYPRVGKSAMRESLNRPFLDAHLWRRSVEQTDEGNVERCTFGIEITPMQLSGRDLFSVWDFAGQIENFVTHQFFISTQSTVFTVVINIRDPLRKQREQLLRWLGLIKMKNLGQITLSSGLLEIEKDTVPMPNKKKGLQPVPVIVVGSHYDLVPVEDQQETVTRVQSLVNEMKVKFEDYLEISPNLYPINCLKAVTQEMKALKDHLCEVRSKLIEVQPLYPRVIELTARKIEALRLEQLKLKVMAWESVKSLVKDEVNKLLSERQLCYVLKCLTNAGVLVYFEHGALSNFVFIDPGWLCQEVLGRALAPQSFPASKIASVGSVEISEDILREKFREHIDDDNLHVIVELLQHFDLCYRLKGTDVFEFPALIETVLDPRLWKPELNFTQYCGRHLVSMEETDSFPPGFFSRLQVSVSTASINEKIHHFKGGFIIDAISYQCLVYMSSSSTSITLTGRSEEACVQDALQLLDSVQSHIGGLVRNVCPTLFLKLMIPSSVDLKNHIDPHYYTIHEIVAGASSDAGKSDVKMVANSFGVKETITDLLYMGDEEYRKAHEGKQTKVAYIPTEIVLQVQELLKDGDTDWKDLAKAINLEKYIQLLESRAPESTRLLLLKWAEKPRWTVNSLLWALKQIGRMDVHNYIKIRF